MVFKKNKKEKPKVEFKEEDYQDDVDEEENEEDEEEYNEPERQPNKTIKKWIVRDVPTQSQRVIVNKVTKEGYDLYSAVVECLNKLDEILRLAKE